jgi:hypothetical protein
MAARKRRRRSARWPVLALMFVALPACRAAAQDGLVRAPAPAPYAVYRPAYPYPGTRPLFLKTYAGHNYGQGPRAAYAPTGLLLEYPQPAGLRPRRSWWCAR